MSSEVEFVAGNGISNIVKLPSDVEYSQVKVFSDEGVRGTDEDVVISW